LPSDRAHRLRLIAVGADLRHCCAILFVRAGNARKIERGISFSVDSTTANAVA
jgi:hypothetical protein